MMNSLSGACRASHFQNFYKPYSEIVPLDERFIDAIVELQRDWGSKWIILRDAFALGAHLSDGHQVYGAFDEKLIAVVLQTFGSPPSELQRSFHQAGLFAKTARIGTLVVNGSYRGRYKAGETLADALISRCETNARARGCTALWARMQTDNDRAGQLFARHGYERKHTGQSPDRPPGEGGTVHTVMKLLM